MSESSSKINSGRKLFFGLFVFPLLIAVGMAILLCSVVLLTHEQQTPESLIEAIKTGSPTKRWEKAFELSNELNTNKASLRSEGVLKEIIYILRDPAHYDSKTRAYMAVALGHFHEPESVEALKKSLKDGSEDVELYALWSLGVLRANEATPDILPFLKNESPEARKMSAYVLGAIGNRATVKNLKALLNDTVADVRWNAALGLARLGDDAGLEILEKMLDRNSLSNDYKMREWEIEALMINATKGLALIKRPESIKILKTVSQGDKNLKVRQAAMAALETLRL